MIEIQGLNTRQQKIADLLWACGSNQQLMAVMAAMDVRDRRDAQGIVEIMIQEYIWENLDDDITSKTYAVDLIDRVSSS